MKEKCNLLEFEIIKKAVAGASIAMVQVVAYFKRCMIFRAKQNGVVNYACLDEMRAKLIKAVLGFKFAGENLQRATIIGCSHGQIELHFWGR